jgi:hypothetical protein
MLLEVVEHATQSARELSSYVERYGAQPASTT